MSYMQNGAKRPASETYDVACKVGCKILDTRTALYPTSRRDNSLKTSRMVIIAFPFRYFYEFWFRRTLLGRCIVVLCCTAM